MFLERNQYLLNPACGTLTSNFVAPSLQTRFVNVSGQQTRRVSDGLYASLHPLHQAQRDEEGSRLGTETR